MLAPFPARLQQGGYANGSDESAYLGGLEGAAERCFAAATLAAAQYRWNSLRIARHPHEIARLKSHSAASR